MPVRPNPRFAGVSPVAHGAFDHEELEKFGVSPENVVDFSSSINPYGPAPEVRAAIGEAVVDRYPDRGSHGLRNALAEKLTVDKSSVAVGNGSAELIDHLARVYLSESDATLISGPTFGEYERASWLCGARVIFHNRRISGGRVSLPVEDLLEAIRYEKPKVVWICNPNNPTGDYLRRGVVERLLNLLNAENGLLILDEAYRDLMLWEEPDDLTDLAVGGNLVLLRSMTKDHSIAGLRLGYAISNPETTAALAVAVPPWNVGSPAQAAGLAALSPASTGHLERSRSRMAQNADYLRRELEKLGLEVAPGAANFLLVRVGNAAGLRRALLRRALQVRDCASFGLPEHIRVSVRREEECRSLISELGPLIGED